MVKKKSKHIKQLRLKSRERDSKYEVYLTEIFALRIDHYTEIEPPDDVDIAVFRDRLGAIIRHRLNRDDVLASYSLRETEDGLLAVIRIR